MSIKAVFSHYDQAPEREKLIYVPCRNFLPEQRKNFKAYPTVYVTNLAKYKACMLYKS